MQPDVFDAKSSVIKWGNGLGVRITKSIAKVAGLDEGTMIEIHADERQVVIKKVELDPTLEEMLAAFDPARHSGEVMASPPVGKEVV
jgi:antitoxin MazE